MIQWPNRLVQGLARRRVVIFVGSGVSANCHGEGGKRPPTWSQLLEEAVEHCASPKMHVKKLINSGDYLSAAEVLRNKMDDEWKPFLRAKFVEPKFTPAEIHESIFMIDTRIVLTQNYDRIFDTFAADRSNNTISVKNYYDSNVAASIREGEQLIVKAHGTIDDLDKIILTRSDYARYRQRNYTFFGLLDALFLTRPVLLIGAGISDPNVQLLLESSSFAHSGMEPHYIVMSKNSMHRDMEAVLKSSYNLKVLWYDGRNHHRELTDSVADLASQVEMARIDVSETMNW